VTSDKYGTGTLFTRFSHASLLPINCWRHLRGQYENMFVADTNANNFGSRMEHRKIFFLKSSGHGDHNQNNE
jgi:hypothetical protein